MMTIKGKCKGINIETGQPCRTGFVLGDGLCIYHSPSYKQKLIQIAIKGGRKRFKSTPKMDGFKVQSLDDLKLYLENVLTAGAQCTIPISPKELATLGKLYLDTTNGTVIEKRLKEVEKQTEKKEKKNYQI